MARAPRPPRLSVSARALVRLAALPLAALFLAACSATPPAEPPTVMMGSTGATSPNAASARSSRGAEGEALPPLPPPESQTPASGLGTDSGAPPAPSGAPRRTPFVAGSATVRLSPAPGAKPKEGDEAVVILRLGPPSCAPLQPDERVFQLRLAWRPGNANSFVQYHSRNGQAELNKGQIEVVVAPATAGAMGRIRVREGADFNVSGGEIDALVCP